MFFAFDLLHLDGWDLTAAPLARRKALLAGLLAGQPANAAIHYSDHVEGNGPAFFEQAADRGPRGRRLEARRRALHARPLEDLDQGQGAADRRLRRSPASPARRRTAGSARWRSPSGSTASSSTAARSAPASTPPPSPTLLARLEPLAGGEPLDGRAEGHRLGAPDPGRPRPLLEPHRRRRGPPRACSAACARSTLTPSEAAPRQALDLRRRPRQRLGDQPDAAAVRPVGPDQARRRGLLRRASATSCCRTSSSRPVSLVRCPTGHAKDCFFQRHAFTGMPPSIARFEVEKTDGEDRTYIAVEDAKRLPRARPVRRRSSSTPGAAAATCIEKPDRIDPRPRPRRGHRLARGGRGGDPRPRRARGGSASSPFAKTTGGKGVHVVVPVTRAADLEGGARRDRASSPSAIAATAPDTFTTTMGAGESASRRIFIDFHRNARSATAVAPYSLRARNNLPGIRAADLGKSRRRRRARGFELRYAPGPGGRLRRSLGGDRRGRPEPAGSPARQGLNGQGDERWRPARAGRDT